VLLIVLVGVGGFIGAVLRYLISDWVNGIFHILSLPYGTLTVNIIGCLLIGILAGLSENRNLLGPETRALLLVGVLGGFTTFSTFGNETVELLKDGTSIAAFSNVALHVCLGLVAVRVGYSAAELS
jgi:CrcB protein